MDNIFRHRVAIVVLLFIVLFLSGAYLPSPLDNIARELGSAAVAALMVIFLLESPSRNAQRKDINNILDSHVKSSADLLAKIEKSANAIGFRSAFITRNLQTPREIINKIDSTFISKKFVRDSFTTKWYLSRADTDDVVNVKVVSEYVMSNVSDEEASWPIHIILDNQSLDRNRSDLLSFSFGETHLAMKSIDLSEFEYAEDTKDRIYVSWKHALGITVKPGAKTIVCNTSQTTRRLKDKELWITSLACSRVNASLYIDNTLKVDYIRTHGLGEFEASVTENWPAYEIIISEVVLPCQGFEVYWSFH